MHSKELTHSINNAKGKITNNSPLIPDVPSLPGQIYRPQPKSIRHDTSTQGSKSSTGIEDINLNINFYFEENSPFQEGIVSETFQRPDIIFSRAKELGNLIDKGKLIQIFLPKQTDIDKILKLIQRKVLKGTHLPVNIKEIHARYLHSSYFKDIFLYISQNKLPSSESVIKKVEDQSE